MRYGLSEYLSPCHLIIFEVRRQVKDNLTIGLYRVIPLRRQFGNDSHRSIRTSQTEVIAFHRTSKKRPLPKLAPAVSIYICVLSSSTCFQLVSHNFLSLPFQMPSRPARSPYSGSRRKLVLAFDVGTTYSGISYRYVPLSATAHWLRNRCLR